MIFSDSAFLYNFPGPEDFPCELWKMVGINMYVRHSFCSVFEDEKEGAQSPKSHIIVHTICRSTIKNVTFISSAMQQADWHVSVPESSIKSLWNTGEVPPMEADTAV